MRLSSSSFEAEPQAVRTALAMQIVKIRAIMSHPLHLKPEPVGVGRAGVQHLCEIAL